MMAGKTTWFGVLVIVVLVGALCLIEIFVLARREVYAPRGAELRCEQVGFRVLDIAQMIADAHIVQPKRRRTRPSKAARAKRIDKKVQRGAVKRGRGKVELD